ncbi:response regulator transcription factor [Actinoplanes palleronii]|uniref:response regulator transcription factor n=1 Tax=Actinoplanes palleronii TaxID=113570 RepID=UPI001945B5C3|nr:response regulator transcription factor [Actinoplanes palleronii]
MRFRALVVDDEPPLVQVVGGYLARDGFDVVSAADGEAAVIAAREHRPDVIVLDLMLPGIDGVEACRRIRTFSDAYIIMLTARSDEVDKLIGLSVGADDYLTKPFSPRELIARVRAMLRRPRAVPDPGVRRFGDLEVDPAGHEVRAGGAPIELTRTEFDLLDTLSAQPRVAFSRRQLLEHVWSGDWCGDDHVIDVHIGNLRHKLGDDAAAPRYIRTVRGVGYRMGTG